MPAPRVRSTGPAGALRELARRTARRSYALTKWRLLRRMERRTGDPVVIFAMGKTATSAIFRSLQSAVDRPVYKIHLLQPESIARSEASYRRTDPSARPRHLLHAAHLRRHLPSPDRPWTVVTVVREPVARAASDYFQSARRLGRLRDVEATEAMLTRFATTQGIPDTLLWFDRQVLPTLGIDVFEHPFDPATGYARIDTPSVRMLVLRQESLDVAPRALGALLGLPGDLEIARENDASDKEYADLYASALRELRFPRATLDTAYGSRYARHFYSPEELAGFRRRWEQPEAPEPPDGPATPDG